MANLDQCRPTGREQTWELGDQHAVGVEAFDPGKQRPRRFVSANRWVEVRGFFDIGRIGKDQVKLPEPR